jgi:hypothetical protein
MTIPRPHMHVDQCRLIHFPEICDRRGSLIFMEGQRHVPFDVKRVFFLSGVPAGESRGAHAHRTLEQVMIAVTGAFDIVLDDGVRQRKVRLDSPCMGLYVPPMVWEVELNFDPQSICLVLASDYYSEADYYRNYDEYLKDLTAAQQGAPARAPGTSASR